MIITIPSYGRPSDQPTAKLVPSAIIVVPDSQYEDYKRYGYKNIITIRDEQDGNISKKRNAVLDLFPWEDVVMLDDDIRYFQKVNPLGKNTRIQDEEGIVAMLKEIYSWMWRTKTDLWWVYAVDYSIAQNGMAYVSLAWFIIGTVMCFSKENKDRFREDMCGKEDHEITVRKIVRGIGVCRLNHYSFVKYENQPKGWVSEQRLKDKTFDKILAHKLISLYPRYVYENPRRPWEVLYKFPKKKV